MGVEEAEVSGELSGGVFSTRLILEGRKKELMTKGVVERLRRRLGEGGSGEEIRDGR